MTQAPTHRAEVLPRHVSFIETGRSRPGRGVVLKLAESLDVPLRERNALLEAAGLGAAFGERRLDEREMGPFRLIVERMLAQHEPYPAFAMDRLWRAVLRNEAADRVFGALVPPDVDLVDGLLGPGPVREVVENYPVVAWTILRRLRREVAQAGPDEELAELLERAQSHLADVPEPDDASDGEVVVCPVFRFGEHRVRTVSTLARFGSARDLTLDELRVELVFPADEESDEVLRALGSSS
ncbi:MAG: transcriptional regulator [Acidobacteriota bacterium]